MNKSIDGPVEVGQFVELEGVTYKITKIEGSVANLAKLDESGNVKRGRPLKIYINIKQE